MSRQFDRSALPPLASAAAALSAPTGRDNKLRLSITLLRKLITEVRRDENIPFYSMRELATHWKVPLRTMALAFQQLETEGLLLRFRGSHTKVLGKKDASISQVAGVVGVPVWLGGLSHYEHRRRFVSSLGESLWSHRLVTDVVFYWHSEDFHTDFVDRLIRHQLDYIVWFQPFRRHLNTIESLRDRGIRTLSICDAELSFMDEQIRINWQPAYASLLREWKEARGIRQLAIVEPPVYLAGRLHLFETCAAAIGIPSVRLADSGSIFRHSASIRSRKSRTGYVFLDQYAPLEFALRDPVAFLKCTKQHRILFARDCPAIPFDVPPGLRIDRITHPTREIIEEVSRRLGQWRGGTFDEPPATFLARPKSNVTVAECRELTSLVVPIETNEAPG